MSAISICKTNGVRQVLILKIRVRAVANVVISALYTFPLLNKPVSHESRRQPALHLFHHKRLPQNPLSLTEVVYVSMGPWHEVEVRSSPPEPLKIDPGDCTSLTTKSLCPVYVYVLYPPSSGLPSVFGRLHMYLPMSSGCSTAASQSSHKCIAV